MTRLDRLKADPYAFYAQQMLAAVGARSGRCRAEPGVARQRGACGAGSMGERRMRCDPSKLAARAEAYARRDRRASGAARAVGAAVARGDRLDRGRRCSPRSRRGRTPLVAEVKGEAVLDGIRLHGRVDRIDRLADGGLAIVDYKTGHAARPQAGRGGLCDAARPARADRRARRVRRHRRARPPPSNIGRWRRRTASSAMSPPRRASVRGSIPPTSPRSRTAISPKRRSRWLTGDAPFVAKLHPELAPYGDYDQLMRLDEWYGRQERSARRTRPL